MCRYLVYGMTERKMGKSVLREKRIEEGDEDREKDRSAFCHCTFYSTFLDFIFFSPGAKVTKIIFIKALLLFSVMTLSSYVHFHKGCQCIHEY